MIQSITPYLFFNGKAREAVDFYSRAVGAETVTMNRFGDVDKSCADAIKDRIMHGELKIGAAIVMFTDGPTSHDAAASARVSLAVATSSPAEMKAKFKALAETGSVVQEIFPAPWGGLFGALTDKYGIHWMWTCSETD
jgi:PhnB protein